MIDQFDFVNNSEVRISFNTVNVPLHHVQFEYANRQTRRTKSQRHGEWPGKFYTGGVLVHMDGEILEANSTDFNNTKLGIVNGILPDPTVFPVTDVKLGELQIKLTGMAEVAHADCTIDGDIDIPMEGLSPSRGSLSITWVVPQGYFIGMSSGNPYYLK
jgi:hypothetical protein